MAKEIPLNGAGKYDDLCSFVRHSTSADGAVVIISNGVLGSGFSVQLPPDELLRLPDDLEAMAKDIRLQLAGIKT